MSKKKKCLTDTMVYFTSMCITRVYVHHLEVKLFSARLFVGRFYNKLVYLLNSLKMKVSKQLNYRQIRYVLNQVLVNTVWIFVKKKIKVVKNDLLHSDWIESEVKRNLIDVRLGVLKIIGSFFFSIPITIAHRIHNI